MGKRVRLFAAGVAALMVAVVGLAWQPSGAILLVAQNAPAKAADPAPMETPSRRLTYEQAITDRNLFRAEMPDFRWARDGVHIEKTVTERVEGEERPRRTRTWIHPETFEEKPAPANVEAAPEEEPTGRRRPPEVSGENSGVTPEGEDSEGDEVGGDAHPPKPEVGEGTHPPSGFDSPQDAVRAALEADGVPARQVRSLLRRPRMVRQGDVTLLTTGARGGDRSTGATPTNGTLWAHHKGGKAVRLIEPAMGDFDLEELSADGKYAAAVLGHNLWLFDTATGESKQMTDDGSDEILNGKLDWALQEEIYGRFNWNAKWFSPDGDAIAFLRLDQTGVPVFSMARDITRPRDFGGSLESLRYPKAGQTVVKTRLGIGHSADGKVVWADLSRFAEQGEFYVVRVGWTPDGKQAWIQVQDRVQSWLELCMVDTTSGKVKTIIREESDCWVDVVRGPRWLKDGSFLWESQRTGYNHLYHYFLDPNLVPGLKAHADRVTAGDWSVRRVLSVDEESGTVTFTATKDGYWNGNTYRSTFERTWPRVRSHPFSSEDLPTDPIRLTPGDGSHTLRTRPDGQFHLNIVSRLDHPGEVRLLSRDGEVLKSLAAASVPGEEQYDTSRWETHLHTLEDGYQMEIALLKPVDFEEGKRYPVWMPIYLGPDLPNVRNSWGGSAWDQFLAQQGYIIMRFDSRVSADKGRHWSRHAYLTSNVQQKDDVVAAIDWVVGKGWGDPERVGMTGTSYGGTMTAFCMTRTDKIAFGWSNAGLYDWAGYDAIYAERYLRTPQENPEGYKASSVIEGAANLHGHLVFTHGSMDENVHMQSAMRLAHALQVNRKQFEMMIYPSQRHGVRDPNQRRHLQDMMWDRMQKHLPGGGR